MKNFFNEISPKTIDNSFSGNKIALYFLTTSSNLGFDIYNR